MRGLLLLLTVACVPVEPVPPVSCTGEMSLTNASLRFVGEPGDHLGTELLAPGDLDGDGHGDLVLSAYGSPTGPRKPRVAVVRGGPRLARAELDAPDARITAGLETLAGVGLAAADWNGDGQMDLLVGAPGADGGRGAVAVLAGPFRGERSVSEADLVVAGEAAGDGVARVDAADLDGDGTVDLIVGGQPMSSAHRGVAYVVHDPQSDVALSEVSHRLTGEPQDLLGRVRVVGDLDGDGLPELLVAAEEADVNGTDSGAVYVVHGPADLDDAYARTFPDLVYGPAGALAGHGVTAAGDLDGDGRDDFVVGAPYDGTDGQGRAYIVTSDVRGAVSLDGMVYLEGEASEDRAGYRVAGVGDVNGDGFDDLLVGAKLHDAAGQDAGAAYLVHGPIDQSMSLADADFKLVGESARDNAGAVEFAGDLTGDGRADLLVGARLYGEDSLAAAGAVYVLSCAR